MNKSRTKKKIISSLCGIQTGTDLPVVALENIVILYQIFGVFVASYISVFVCACF